MQLEKKQIYIYMSFYLYVLGQLLFLKVACADVGNLIHRLIGAASFNSYFMRKKNV